MANKPTIIKPLTEVVPIAKPGGFSLDKFKSKQTAVANVGTLQTSLPHYKLSDAKDFVRLHSDEENYWSPELCFVNVPIKGAKKESVHLIEEDLALQFLPRGRIQRFRLALASKPFDIFFLCHVPTRNTDNKWNEDALTAAERAKSAWVQATSLREENKEGYKIEYARDQDSFGEPKWPTQTLTELIELTFAGRLVDHSEHPALLRLIGARQDLS
jgi:hypothetical protein